MEVEQKATRWPGQVGQGKDRSLMCIQVNGPKVCTDAREAARHERCRACFDRGSPESNGERPSEVKQRYEWKQIFRAGAA